jgi:hypothetical protein
MKEPFPRCFDTAHQYAAWKQAARGCYPSPGHSYCEDCTSEFQSIMILGNRCAFPGTTFSIGPDGGLQGKRSLYEVRLIKSGAEIHIPMLSREG